MRSTIKYFIEHPTVVNLCLFLLVGIGIFQLVNTRTTTFPTQRIRFIDVTVPYPGATPEEVEEGITLKIEEELQSVDGIDRITSRSQNSLAVVNIEMTENAETNVVVAEVKNAIDKINNFPRGVDSPIIEKRDVPNLALAFAITGEVPLQVKKDFADQIENELLAKRGVSEVLISGTPDQEIEIAVSEEALQRYELSFQRVAAAVSAANLNTFGGEIKTNERNINLKADSKGYYAKDLENIIVAASPEGGTIRLRDVAMIKDQFKDDPGSRYLGDDRVITVTVNALQDEDVIGNAQLALAYLEEFNTRNDAIQLKVIEDGTIQVTDRISSMTSSGVTGVILVLLVLALFLNRYLAFWVALKIPIAIVASFILRDIQGLTINVVSLFGFILVLGILVDDGVVIGENIYRWAKEKGASPAKAALEGTMEMVTPILISISTTAVAFSMFFFLPTQAGEFFGEMGFVVIAVLFMAVIESFFFLPAHLAHSKALKEDTKLTKIEEWFNGSVDWVRDNLYRPTVDHLSTSGLLRVLTLVGFTAALVGMFAMVGSGKIPFTFFPNLDDDAHFIELEMPAGTPEAVTYQKLAAIQEAAYRANTNLREQTGVEEDFIRYVEVVTGPRANQGQLKVTYMSGEKRELSSFDISEAIRAEAPPMPEAESIIYGLGASTALFGKPVAFSLRSYDLADLRLARDDLKQAMQAHPGLKDVSDNDQAGVQDAIISLKPQAYNLGLDLAAVMNQVRAAYFGVEAQSLQRGSNEVEVWLRYPRNERNSERQLRDMRISDNAGGSYPLSEIAEIEYGSSVLSLNHISGEREITLDANVASANVSAPTVINDIQANVLPAIAATYPSVTYSLEGQNRQSFKMSGAIASIGPIIFLFIFGLIVLNFNSFSQAFLVFLMYPFALIGVIFGHWVHAVPLNIFSVVGTIALIGVFTNDSLVFISTFNQRLEEGDDFLAALKEAARSRFRPILLTTVTTVAGLAPLITSSSLGAQFLKGPAIAIAYGMAIGLFTILLMLPTFLLLANRLRRLNYHLFHRKQALPTAAQLEPAVKNLAHRIKEY
ncbi:MAG: efflux RND transporter permease subunit [Bacteroidota bacterium]